MIRHLEWHAQARRDLRRLSQEDSKRVYAALLRYAQTEHGDVRQLVGYVPPHFRLRAGDIRAIFQLEGNEVLLVLRVLHRREAYR